MSAVISTCGTYRYFLTRPIEDARTSTSLLFVMLNPSTADAETDDATIRKCRGFARQNDFASFEVVNLFAFRSRHPLDLLGAADPVGPMNDDHIIHAAQTSSRVCVAWGAVPSKLEALVRPRVAHVAHMLAAHHKLPLLCVGTTKLGSPRHPVMAPYRSFGQWVPA